MILLFYFLQFPSRYLSSLSASLMIMLEIRPDYIFVYSPDECFASGRFPVGTLPPHSEPERLLLVKAYSVRQEYRFPSSRGNHFH